MKEKVKNYIIEKNMIKKGDKILIALSGGPDSIALTHVLYTLKEYFDIQLFAAHINHCVRGHEADEDEDYAKEFCGRLNIPFFSLRIDINELAKNKGISTEMAGREARYDFFNKIKKEHNIDKIALAHNSNDQAETLLMRIMRGTGIQGLIGIKPVRDEYYIRPILGIDRTKIEEYCQGNNLMPRIDKTNLETIYSRNKVRLELIPYIKDNFNEDIVDTLNRLSETIEKDNDFLEDITSKYFNEYIKINNGEIIIDKDAFSLHEAMITRVIRRALEKLTGDLVNFEKVHIYDIIKLNKQGTGKSINLPKGVLVQNIYGDLVLSFLNKKSVNSKTELKISQELLSKEVLSNGITLNENILGYGVSLKLISNNDINFKNNNFTKYFDIGEDIESIVIRNRQDGDRFNPYGMMGTKKLKDIFIDLKVRKDLRDNIPLVLINEKIAWIVGYRVSNAFKVSRNSRNILEIKFEGEENDNA